MLALLLGLALTAGYAATLVSVTWWLASRRGTRWFPVAWILGALAFAVLTFAKLQMQRARLGVPPRSPLDRWAVFAALGSGLVGAGFTTLSVRKRLRRSADGRLTPAAIGAGVGAFLMGIFVVFLVVAIDDLAALLRQMGR